MSRLMRDGLTHPHPGFGDVKMFEMIDSTGGWPVGYQYVGFEHTEERKAGFCNSSYNDGWWTVVYSADDYYTYKLSPAAIGRIADAVIRRCADTLRGTKKDKLDIRNSRGYTASLQTEQP